MAAWLVGARAFIAPMVDLGCPRFQAIRMGEASVTSVHVDAWRLRLFLNELVDPGKKLPMIDTWIVDGARTQAIQMKLARFLPRERVRVAYSPVKLGRMVSQGCWNDDPSYVGHVVPGADIRIVDANGQTLPRGVYGGVMVSGVTTGDRGYLDEKDGLHLGVTSEGPIVTVHGEQVSLPRIESVLATIKGVHMARVRAFLDPGGDLQVVAYVCGDLSDQQLRAALNDKLTDAECPVSFEHLETTSTETDLPLPSWLRPANARPPATASEKSVAEVFCRILGVQVSSVTDDFFLLGGDSMAAVQLVGELANLGVLIELRELRGCSTVAALAEKRNQSIKE